LEEKCKRDDEIERKRLWHMEKVSKVGLFGEVGSEISV